MLCDNVMSYRIPVLRDNPVSKLYLVMFSNSIWMQFEVFVGMFCHRLDTTRTTK